MILRLIKLSETKEFDLHENEFLGSTHFHMRGFARRPVMTERQKSTRKMANLHKPAVASLKIRKKFPPKFQIRKWKFDLTVKCISAYKE